MKRMFCVLTMLCVLASGVTVHAEENAATLDGTNGDVLYQVALIQSLVQGYYDGIITVGELKQHGDTGIGTFEGRKRFQDLMKDLAIGICDHTEPSY